ncbi:MAG: opacity family porin [archaeon]
MAKRFSKIAAILLTTLLPLIPVPAFASSDSDSKSRDKYFETRGNFGLDFNFYNLKINDDVQTVDVHPDDAGFLSGTTDTNLNSGEDIGLRLGVEGSYGTDVLRFLFGADAIINSGFFADGYREGMYDVKKQSSDRRPGDNASFVYTQFVPGLVTLEPYVGGRISSESIGLVGKIGLPLMIDAEVESGHDRYGEFESVTSESDNPIGISGSLGIEYNLADDVTVNLSIGYQSMEASFGEINSIRALAGVSYDF